MRVVFLIVSALLLISGDLHSQDLPTFEWEIESSISSAQPGDEFTISFKTDIPEGLHIYSSKIKCEIGPNPSDLVDLKVTGADTSGGFNSVDAHSEYDDIFECEVSYFKKKAHFAQNFVMMESQARIEGVLEYQVCLENGMCIVQKEAFNILIE